MGAIGWKPIQEVKGLIAEVSPTLWVHFREDLQADSSKLSLAIVAEAGLQGGRI